jgi:two-component system NtrC family sensor kinase
VSPGRESLEQAALSELRHNLRTPVNHILGYTELLIEDASDARHTAALDPLRQVHSTARAALADINTALAGRDSVDGAEIDALCEKIRPRVERIENCIAHLRESREVDAPPEWVADFDRIVHAAGALLDILGVARPATSAPEPEPAEPRAEAGRARILVVDDNAANRHVICRRLERQGYAVEEAPNGDIALDRIATEPFDVVLLDIMMPVMDGFQVLDHMRRDRRMRAVPVVVISALDEVDSVVRAIEMGAEDYLFKPFDPVLLKARIGALLERKRLAAELAVQAKLASLVALTAGIAHEIKNPLNFVINFAQLASESAKKQLKTLENDSQSPVFELALDIDHDIGKILEHAKRADAIIASMLAHSRGQPGERQPTDLNALAREFVHLALHGTTVAIETELDPHVGVVNVVPQDLSRVFLNLATNAVHALRNRPNPQIRLTTCDLGDEVEIRIRDNGAGIPKAVRDRIFDPFFTTKPAGEGAGLGLSLAHDIVVQEHGGEISVESEEGEFTEFTIVIPRVTA